jgi:dihydrorhizobitoxine desaturase
LTEREFLVDFACCVPKQKMRLYEHKNFSREIEKNLASLKKLNNWCGLLAFLEDIAVIAMAIILSWNIKFLYPLSVFLIGSRMRGLASLLHESTHQILAKNHFLNTILGIASGYPIMQLPSVYQLSHVRDHHLFLGDPEKDDDYQYHIEEGLYNNMETRDFLKKYVISVIFLQRTPSLMMYLFKNRFLGAASQLHIQRTKMEFLGLLVFWLTSFSSSLYFNFQIFLFLYWIMPLLLVFPIINWFCELGEHYPLVATEKNDLYISRNRLGTRIERFFFGIHCDHMHAEHHLNPAIPFWNLHKSREIRLKDSDYFSWDQCCGGLFTKGINGSPSVLEQILKYHSLQTEKKR